MEEKSTYYLTTNFKDNIKKYSILLEDIQKQLKNIKENKEETLNIDMNNVVKTVNNIFFFKQIAIEMSNYLRTFEDFENLQYLLLAKDIDKKDQKSSVEENDSVENFNLNLSPVEFKNFMLNDKTVFNKKVEKYFKEYFGSSEKLIEINNDLLEIANYIENCFLNNLNDIGYTDKTSLIVNYFNDNPKIFSFFLSLGVPDKEKIDIFQHFLSLYNNNFLSLTLVEDELFNYLAMVYSINEIIKMISYILPKTIMKEI